MGKVSVPAVPQKADELSHEGLLFLLQTIAPSIYRRDLASARWHELVRTAERAHNAWRAACKDVDAAFDRVKVGSRTYHHDALARDAARAKERRLYRAYERADDAATAFFDTHVCPRQTAPAADECA